MNENTNHADFETAKGAYLSPNASHPHPPSLLDAAKAVVAWEEGLRPHVSSGYRMATRPIQIDRLRTAIAAEEARQLAVTVAERMEPPRKNQGLTPLSAAYGVLDHAETCIRNLQLDDDYRKHVQRDFDRLSDAADREYRENPCGVSPREVAEADDADGNILRADLSRLRAENAELRAGLENVLGLAEKGIMPTRADADAYLAKAKGETK